MIADIARVILNNAGNRAVLVASGHGRKRQIRHAFCQDVYIRVWWMTAVLQVRQKDTPLHSLSSVIQREYKKILAVRATCTIKRSVFVYDVN
jgi:hypothetical protein